MKTKTSYIKYALVVLMVIGGFSKSVKAQNQFHMGQYMVHQPFLNPASMASFNHLNAALFYKNQWTGFEGAPTIQGLNVSAPIGKKKSFIGLTLIHDKIGINDATEISGTYAYKLKTSLKSRLVFSLTASLNLIQSDLAELHIQDQNDPLFIANSPTFALPNFKFGSYFYKKKFYVGFAVPNILENKVVYSTGLEGEAGFNFDNLHYYLHSGYTWALSQKTDLNTSFLVKEVKGSPLQFDINAQAMFDKKFGIGVSYRSSQELLAMASFRLIPELLFSYGYEFNFAELGNYSSGTHEILLTYAFNPPSKPIIAIPRF